MSTPERNEVHPSPYEHLYDRYLLSHGDSKHVRYINAYQTDDGSEIYNSEVLADCGGRPAEAI
jgi:hypothetical protein